MARRLRLKLKKITNFDKLLQAIELSEQGEHVKTYLEQKMDKFVSAEEIKLSLVYWLDYLTASEVSTDINQHIIKILNSISLGLKPTGKHVTETNQGEYMLYGLREG